LSNRVRLKIDDRTVEVDEGSTVLEAARELGIDIPTMCFMEGCTPATSCMVCIVKILSSGELVPACATRVLKGMDVESQTDQIRQIRKAAIELLLSDHVGDCLGPCHVTCPAKMDIPLMIRQINSGDLSGALVTVKRDIALPAILGRICPAPCENACRRARFDQPVSICLLKRFAADVDLQSSDPYVPHRQPSKQKQVAVIGAGPAGLSCAYYLWQSGYDCTVFDDHDKPGGMLRYGIDEGTLSREVMDKEIGLIIQPGVKFQGNTHIGTDISMQQLQEKFDAVFVAIGELKPDEDSRLGLKTDDKGITIDPATCQTKTPAIFAGGNAVGKRRLAVRSAAHGKEAAESIDRFLSGQKPLARPKVFNHRMGKMLDGEVEKFAELASKAGKCKPLKDGQGLSDQQAEKEAARCLHCDCRKVHDCKLKQYAQQYGANSKTYQAERRPFVQYHQHPDVIYEPGKCIDCGLCIQIASRSGEKLGLTFVGRGFDVKVAVPFDRSIAEGLTKTAAECIKACPTGALAPKSDGN